MKLWKIQKNLVKECLMFRLLHSVTHLFIWKTVTMALVEVMRIPTPIP